MLMERVAGCWWNDWPDVRGTRGRMAWNTQTRKGHHHKQALCAVANRLVNRIFSVLRSGKPYVLRDSNGRELSVTEAKAIVAECYNVPEAVRATRRANRASNVV
jgi:hypothetical protein